MSLYIAQANGGTSLIYFLRDQKPAAEFTVTDLNGFPPAVSTYKLIDTFDGIVNVQRYSNRDYGTWRMALECKIKELGGGDVNTGFDTLTAAQKKTAAAQNIGSGAQILAAIPNDTERDAAYLEYLAKMEAVVRPNRAKLLKMSVLSRCKAIDILVSSAPDVYTPMPDVLYSKIIIDNPSSSAGEILGNLLSDGFVQVGILGKIKGGDTVGIFDYLLSNAATRYNAAGFAEDFAGVVPSGFADIAAYRDYLADLLEFGQVDNVTVS